MRIGLMKMEQLHGREPNGIASGRNCRAEAYPRVTSQILIGAAGRAVSGAGGRGRGPGDFAAPRLSLT